MQFNNPVFKIVLGSVAVSILYFGVQKYRFEQTAIHTLKYWDACALNSMQYNHKTDSLSKAFDGCNHVTCLANQCRQMAELMQDWGRMESNIAVMGVDDSLVRSQLLGRRTFTKLNLLYSDLSGLYRRSCDCKDSNCDCTELEKKSEKITHKIDSTINTHNEKFNSDDMQIYLTRKYHRHFISPVPTKTK